MKTIQITEEQFNNVMGTYLTSFGNPLTLYMNDSKALNEGMFKTYPADKVKQYIVKMFRCPASWVDYQETEQEGLSFFLIKTPKNKTYINALTKAMALCGYFRSHSNMTHEPEYAYIQFEPRKQNNANEEVRSMDYIYHVSPVYNKNKILANGLTPKSKNNLFDYPDRVYFFKQDTTEEEIKSFTSFLSQENTSLGNNKQYTIFVIDVKSIPETVNFYLDGNYSNGLYTTDNISPQAIVHYLDFMVENRTIEEMMNEENEIKNNFDVNGLSINLKISKND